MKNFLYDAAILKYFNDIELFAKRLRNNILIDQTVEMGRLIFKDFKQNYLSPG